MNPIRVCRSCLRGLGGHQRQRFIGNSSQRSISMMTRHQPHSTAFKATSHIARSFASATPTSTVEPSDESQLHNTDAERRSKRLPEDAGIFSDPDATQQATETLLKECARQADYIIPQRFERDGKVPKNEAGEEVGEGTGWWYENLGLKPTFNTWAQVTFLHMYLITVRLRYFPPSHAQPWIHQFHNAFFWEAEHRMTVFHDMHSRAIRNRYLKDLYNQWRGAVGAYDEGIMSGDAVLAAAVWRNVFRAAGAKHANEKEEPDWRKVAMVVGYMRRALRGLDRTSDKTVTMAMMRFGNPMDEKALVEERSPLVDRPFDAEVEKQFEELHAKK